MVPAAVYAQNNGGVAVGDVDKDDWMDLLILGSVGNVLYLNKGGKFEKAQLNETAPALLLPAEVALFLDYDNDGDADLFLTAVSGEHRLLENRIHPAGRLEFVDSSDRLGEYSKLHADFTLAAADVNQDTFPDVYVAAWGDPQQQPNRYDGATNGRPNLLFMSQGDGTFREVAQEMGVDDSRWGHAVQFADVDEDGRVDIYLANDFSGGNSLLLNRGERFEDVAADRGVVDRGWGMGVSFGDYDNDGDLDLHVTRMSSTAGGRILQNLSSDDVPDKQQLHLIGNGNKIYENTGGGNFRAATGVGELFAGWSYGGGFLDIDNDGWEDLHAPSGFWSGKSMKDT